MSILRPYSINNTFLTSKSINRRLWVVKSIQHSEGCVAWDWESKENEISEAAGWSFCLADIKHSEHKESCEREQHWQYRSFIPTHDVWTVCRCASHAVNCLILCRVVFHFIFKWSGPTCNNVAVFVKFSNIQEASSNELSHCAPCVKNLYLL